MVVLELTKQEKKDLLTFKKRELLKKYQNCLGDLERWEVKKELMKLEKELDKY